MEENKYTSEMAANAMKKEMAKIRFKQTKGFQIILPQNTITKQTVYTYPYDPILGFDSSGQFMQELMIGLSELDTISEVRKFFNNNFTDYEHTNKPELLSFLKDEINDSNLDALFKKVPLQDIKDWVNSWVEEKLKPAPVIIQQIVNNVESKSNTIDCDLFLLDSRSVYISEVEEHLIRNGQLTNFNGLLKWESKKGAKELVYFTYKLWKSRYINSSYKVKEKYFKQLVKFLSERYNCEINTQYTEKGKLSNLIEDKDFKLSSYNKIL